MSFAFLYSANNLLSSYKSNSDEARILRNYEAELQELSKMWDEMLMKSVETNKALESKGITGDKFAESVKTDSRTETDNKSGEAVQEQAREEYITEINTWVKDGKPDGEIFVLGSTGDVLQGLGAIESDIYMLGNKIKEILSKHTEMTIDEIKKIPQILDDPVLILKSQNIDRNNSQNTRLVIFGSIKTQDGKPILSVLDLQPIESNLVVDDMQKVSSAYTKDTNPVDFIKNSIVVYANKKITPKLLRTIGFQTPIELQQNGYIGSISYKGQNVNITGEKFSKVFSENTSDVQNSDRDTEGRTLSEGQMEYFKDSVARDENGNLTTTDFSKTGFITENGIRLAMPNHRDIKALYDGLGGDTAVCHFIDEGNVRVKASAPGIEISSRIPITLRQASMISRFISQYKSEGRFFVDFTDIEGHVIKSFEYYNGNFSAQSIIGDIREYYDSLESENVQYSDRNYSYEDLVSKPNMELTVVSNNIPNKRTDILRLAKQNVAKVGKKNPNGSLSVYVDDIDTDVIIGTDGLKHGLRRAGSSEANNIVTLKAGEIIKSSIKINELIPSKAEAKKAYVLIGAAKNLNGDLYIVRSVINKYSNELTSMDVLYAIIAKKESAALNAPRFTGNPLSVTDSTISIADLLDYVNKYFPDILPASVLRHYGHAERPKGELGNDALYQDRYTESIYDLMGKSEKLKRTNELLEADVERLKELLRLEKKLTGGKVFKGA